MNENEDIVINNDIHWMSEALKLAEQAKQLDEVPIGAVIVKDGQIIGRGYNRREMDHNPLGHAELMAILDASQTLGGWRLEQCDLYVTLEPCPMCAGALVQARIRRLIFGAEDPKSGYAGSLYNVLHDERLNHQVLITKGVLQEECQQVLKSFFQTLRKRSKSNDNQYIKMEDNNT